MGHIDEEEAAGVGKREDGIADEEQAFLPQHESTAEKLVPAAGIDGRYYISVIVNIAAAVGLVRVSMLECH